MQQISPLQTPPVRQGRLCTGGSFCGHGTVRRFLPRSTPLSGEDWGNKRLRAFDDNTNIWSSLN
jgi:hypothetical protein